MARTPGAPTRLPLRFVGGKKVRGVPYRITPAMIRAYRRRPPLLERAARPSRLPAVGREREARRPPRRIPTYERMRARLAERRPPRGPERERVRRAPARPARPEPRLPQPTLPRYAITPQEREGLRAEIRARAAPRPPRPMRPPREREPWRPAAPPPPPSLYERGPLALPLTAEQRQRVTEQILRPLRAAWRGVGPVLRGEPFGLPLTWVPTVGGRGLEIAPPTGITRAELREMEKRGELPVPGEYRRPEMILPESELWRLPPEVRQRFIAPYQAVTPEEREAEQVRERLRQERGQFETLLKAVWTGLRAPATEEEKRVIEEQIAARPLTGMRIAGIPSPLEEEFQIRVARAAPEYQQLIQRYRERYGEEISEGGAGALAFSLASTFVEPYYFLLDMGIRQAAKMGIMATKGRQVEWLLRQAGQADEVTRLRYAVRGQGPMDTLHTLRSFQTRVMKPIRIVPVFDDVGNLVSRTEVLSTGMRARDLAVQAARDRATYAHIRGGGMGVSDDFFTSIYNTLGEIGERGWPEVMDDVSDLMGRKVVESFPWSETHASKMNRYGQLTWDIVRDLMEGKTPREFADLLVAAVRTPDELASIYPYLHTDAGAIFVTTLQGFTDETLYEFASKAMLTPKSMNSMRWLVGAGANRLYPSGAPNIVTRSYAAIKNFLSKYLFGSSPRFLVRSVGSDFVTVFTDTGALIPHGRQWYDDYLRRWAGMDPGARVAPIPSAAGKGIGAAWEVGLKPMLEPGVPTGVVGVRGVPRLPAIPDPLFESLTPGGKADAMEWARRVFGAISPLSEKPFAWLQGMEIYNAKRLVTWALQVLQSTVWPYWSPSVTEATARALGLSLAQRRALQEHILRSLSETELLGVGLEKIVPSAAGEVGEPYRMVSTDRLRNLGPDGAMVGDEVNAHLTEAPSLKGYLIRHRRIEKRLGRRRERLIRYRGKVPPMYVPSSPLEGLLPEDLIRMGYMAYPTAMNEARLRQYMKEIGELAQEVGKGEQATAQFFAVWDKYNAVGSQAAQAIEQHWGVTWAEWEEIKEIVTPSQASDFWGKARDRADGIWQWHHTEGDRLFGGAYQVLGGDVEALMERMQQYPWGPPPQNVMELRASAVGDHAAHIAVKSGLWSDKEKFLALWVDVFGPEAPTPATTVDLRLLAAEDPRAGEILIGRMREITGFPEAPGPPPAEPFPPPPPVPEGAPRPPAPPGEPPPGLGAMPYLQEGETIRAIDDAQAVGIYRGDVYEVVRIHPDDPFLLHVRNITPGPRGLEESPRVPRTLFERAPELGAAVPESREMLERRLAEIWYGRHRLDRMTDAEWQTSYGRGKPKGKTVTVYRGAWQPERKHFNSGSWCTLDKKWARNYAGPEKEGGEVFKRKVLLHELVEWGTIESGKSELLWRPERSRTFQEEITKRMGGGPPSPPPPPGLPPEEGPPPPMELPGPPTIAPEVPAPVAPPAVAPEIPVAPAGRLPSIKYGGPVPPGLSNPHLNVWIARPVEVELPEGVSGSLRRVDIANYLAAGETVDSIVNKTLPPGIEVEEASRQELRKAAQAVADELQVRPLEALLPERPVILTGEDKAREMAESREFIETWLERAREGGDQRIWQSLAGEYVHLLEREYDMPSVTYGHSEYTGAQVPWLTLPPELPKSHIKKFVDLASLKMELSQQEPRLTIARRVEREIAEKHGLEPQGDAVEPIFTDLHELGGTEEFAEEITEVFYLREDLKEVAFSRTLLMEVLWRVGDLEADIAKVMAKLPKKWHGLAEEITGAPAYPEGVPVVTPPPEVSARAPAPVPSGEEFDAAQAVVARITEAEAGEFTWTLRPATKEMRTWSLDKKTPTPTGFGLGTMSQQGTFDDAMTTLRREFQKKFPDALLPHVLQPRAPLPEVLAAPPEALPEVPPAPPAAVPEVPEVLPMDADSIRAQIEALRPYEGRMSPEVEARYQDLQRVLAELEDISGVLGPQPGSPQYEAMRRAGWQADTSQKVFDLARTDEALSGWIDEGNRALAEANWEEYEAVLRKMVARVSAAPPTALVPEVMVFAEGVDGRTDWMPIAEAQSRWNLSDQETTFLRERQHLTVDLVEEGRKVGSIVLYTGKRWPRPVRPRGAHFFITGLEKPADETRAILERAIYDPAVVDLFNRVGVKEVRIQELPHRGMEGFAVLGSHDAAEGVIKLPWDLEIRLSYLGMQDYEILQFDYRAHLSHEAGHFLHDKVIATPGQAERWLQLREMHKDALGAAVGPMAPRIEHGAEQGYPEAFALAFQLHWVGKAAPEPLGTFFDEMMGVYYPMPGVAAPPVRVTAPPVEVTIEDVRGVAKSLIDDLGFSLRIRKAVKLKERGSHLMGGKYPDGRTIDIQGDPDFLLKELEILRSQVEGRWEPDRPQFVYRVEIDGRSVEVRAANSNQAVGQALKGRPHGLVGKVKKIGKAPDLKGYQPRPVAEVPTDVSQVVNEDQLKEALKKRLLKSVHYGVERMRQMDFDGEYGWTNGWFAEKGKAPKGWQIPEPIGPPKRIEDIAQTGRELQDGIPVGLAKAPDSEMEVVVIALSDGSGYWLVDRRVYGYLVNKRKKQDITWRVGAENAPMDLLADGERVAVVMPVSPGEQMPAIIKDHFGLPFGVEVGVPEERVAEAVAPVERAVAPPAELEAAYKRVTEEVYPAFREASDALTEAVRAGKSAGDEAFDAAKATEQTAIQALKDSSDEFERLGGWETYLRQQGRWPDEPWQMSRDEYKGPSELVWGDEGSTSYYRRGHEWEWSTKGAVSEGRLTPEQAQELGLYQPSPPPAYGYRGDPRNYWQELPQDQPLYHVTTARTAVGEVGLKSRFELDLQRGTGLGGGEDDAISFTTDRTTAEVIEFTLKEARRLARGEITIEDLIRMAQEGEGAERPWVEEWFNHYDRPREVGDPIPWRLEDLILGSERISTHVGKSAEDMVAEGWTVIESSKTFPATAHPDIAGQPAAETFWNWQRPMSEESFAQRVYDAYNAWLWQRQAAGGPENPVFFLADFGALAMLPEEEIALLEFRAKPGSMGVQLSGLVEWRTYSGAAVDPVTAGVPVVQPGIAEAVAPESIIPIPEERIAIKIWHETTGVHHHQVDRVLKATDPVTGEYRGHLDYSYLDEPGENILIRWVEVPEEFRRQGIGRQLFEELKATNPDRGIDWGYMTEFGEALRKAVAPTVEAVAPEVAPPRPAPEEMTSIQREQRISDVESLINEGEIRVSTGRDVSGGELTELQLESTRRDIITYQEELRRLQAAEGIVPPEETAIERQNRIQKEVGYDAKVRDQAYELAEADPDMEENLRHQKMAVAERDWVRYQFYLEEIVRRVRWWKQAQISGPKTTLPVPLVTDAAEAIWAGIRASVSAPTYKPEQGISRDTHMTVLSEPTAETRPVAIENVARIYWEGAYKSWYADIRDPTDPEKAISRAATSPAEAKRVIEIKNWGEEYPGEFWNPRFTKALESARGELDEAALARVRSETRKGITRAKEQQISSWLDVERVSGRRRIHELLNDAQEMIRDMGGLFPALEHLEGALLRGQEIFGGSGNPIDPEILWYASRLEIPPGFGPQSGTPETIERFEEWLLQFPPEEQEAARAYRDVLQKWVISFQPRAAYGVTSRQAFKLPKRIADEWNRWLYLRLNRLEPEILPREEMVPFETFESLLGTFLGPEPYQSYAEHLAVLNSRELMDSIAPPTPGILRPRKGPRPKRVSVSALAGPAIEYEGQTGKLVGHTKLFNLYEMEDGRNLAIPREYMEPAAGAGTWADLVDPKKPPQQIAGGPDLPPDSVESQIRLIDLILERLKEIEEEVKARWGITEAGDVGLYQRTRAWLEDEVMPVMRQFKAYAEGYAGNVRDFALHDYTNRRTFDTLLSFLYWWQFWSTRTGWKWMGRLLDNPHWAVLYQNYIDTIESQNKDLPEQYRRTVPLPGWIPFFNRIDPLIFHPLYSFWFAAENFPRLWKRFGPIYAVLRGSPSSAFVGIEQAIRAAEAMDEGEPVRIPPIGAHARFINWATGKDPEAIIREPVFRLLFSGQAWMARHLGDAEAVAPEILTEEEYMPTYVSREVIEAFEAGELSEEEMDWALYSQQGTGWLGAQEMARRTRGPTEFVSFFTGLRPRRMIEAEQLIHEANQEYWGMQALRRQIEGLPVWARGQLEGRFDQWQEDFEGRYPWFRGWRMRYRPEERRLESYETTRFFEDNEAMRERQSQERLGVGQERPGDTAAMAELRQSQYEESQTRRWQAIRRGAAPFPRTLDTEDIERMVYAAIAAHVPRPDDFLQEDEEIAWVRYEYVYKRFWETLPDEILGFEELREVTERLGPPVPLYAIAKRMANEKTYDRWRKNNDDPVEALFYVWRESIANPGWEDWEKLMEKEPEDRDYRMLFRKYLSKPAEQFFSLIKKEYPLRFTDEQLKEDLAGWENQMPGFFELRYRNSPPEMIARDLLWAYDLSLSRRQWRVAREQLASPIFNTYFLNRDTRDYNRIQPNEWRQWLTAFGLPDPWEDRENGLTVLYNFQVGEGRLQVMEPKEDREMRLAFPTEPYAPIEPEGVRIPGMVAAITPGESAAYDRWLGLMTQFQNVRATNPEAASAFWQANAGILEDARFYRPGVTSQFWDYYYGAIPPGRIASEIREDPIVTAILSRTTRDYLTDEGFAEALRRMQAWAAANPDIISIGNPQEWAMVREVVGQWSDLKDAGMDDEATALWKSYGDLLEKYYPSDGARRRWPSRRYWPRRRYASWGGGGRQWGVAWGAFQRAVPPLLQEALARYWVYGEALSELDLGALRTVYERNPMGADSFEAWLALLRGLWEGRPAVQMYRPMLPRQFVFQPWNMR